MAQGRCESPDERITVPSVDGSWRPAAHPLHQDRPEKAAVGPGLTFAQAVVDFLPTGSTVRLLPCAVGGTAIAEWAPESPLFARAVDAVRTAVRGGARLAGILWHQGESDCATPEQLSAYDSALRRTIAALTTSCGAGDVPFILGELGVHFLNVDGDQRFANAFAINRVIADVARSSGPRVGIASARGLPHNGDRLHFSAEGARLLGKRYAWQWLALTGRVTTSLRILASEDVHCPLLADEARDGTRSGRGDKRAREESAGSGDIGPAALAAVID